MSQLPLELNTALTLQQQGQHEIAEQLCRQFLSREPGHAEGCYILGTLLLHQQRGEEALVEFQQALQQSPANGDYWLGVTEALLQLNRPRDAFQTINDLINKGLDWPAAMTLRERAREALQQVRGENDLDLSCFRSNEINYNSKSSSDRILKKIVLFNAVKKGGVTYAKYLMPISNSLKKAGLNYLVINIPDHCEIDNETLECMLEHSVLSMSMIEVPSLECDVVISNDAYLGRLLDDSVEAIFIGHGATPMPVSDPFYFSGWTAYWDGVIVSSLTSINLFCTGLRKYRQFRKQLKIPTPQDALRSDLRSTNIYHINPIKIPSLFDLEYSDSEFFLKDKIVVGILPSSLNVAGNNTLYRYMVDILSAIFFILPKAFVILRPYPLDLSNAIVAKVIAQINDKVQIDDSCSASDLFYSKCHLIITDVSTGGVTFMLRRGCPAIYYLPAIGNSSIEKQWLKEMQDYIFVATSSETLKSQITKAKEMFGDPIRSVAKNFAYKEYGGKHIDQFVESFINSRQNKDIFKSCATKSITSSGCVIDLDK